MAKPARYVAEGDTYVLPDGGSQPKPRSPAKPKDAKPLPPPADIPKRLAQFDVAPISRFKIAEENPRTLRPADQVAALAANLKAHGQLQPVICYADGAFLAITCGGTRMIAAGKAGLAVLSYDLLPREDAIRAGLAEQEGHTELHPADQARAYAAAIERLNGEGPLVREAAIETLAKRVGKTARFVAQRLALADLHPPILTALGADKISVKQAEAWANAPIERQVQLWLDKGNHEADPAEIKQAVDKADLAETDRLAKFVGEAAYKAAGGAVRQDLFDVDLEPWEAKRSAKGHLDRAIVQKLAKEKLAEAKAKLEAEGWGEVKTTLAISHSGYSEKAKPKTKEERAKYRAEISIDDKGKISIVRGLRIKTKEAAEKSAGRQSYAQQDAVWRKEQAARQAKQRLENIALQIVGRSVGSKPGLALAIVTAALAREAFDLRKAPPIAELAVNVSHVEYGLASDKATSAARKAWEKRLAPHVANLEAWLLKQDCKLVDELLACIVADSLELSNYGARHPGAEARIAEIAELAGVDATKHVSPKTQDAIDSDITRALLGLPALPKPAAKVAPKSTKKPAKAKK